MKPRNTRRRASLDLELAAWAAAVAVVGALMCGLIAYTGRVAWETLSAAPRASEPAVIAQAQPSGVLRAATLPLTDQTSTPAPPEQAVTSVPSAPTLTQATAAEEPTVAVTQSPPQGQPS